MTGSGGGERDLLERLSVAVLGDNYSSRESREIAFEVRAFLAGPEPALSPAEGFEEWHRRECFFVIHSPYNTGPCSGTRFNKNLIPHKVCVGFRCKERMAIFAGRTCREVYDSEHPGAGVLDKVPGASRTPLYGSETGQPASEGDGLPAPTGTDSKPPSAAGGEWSPVKVTAEDVIRGAVGSPTVFRPLTTAPEAAGGGLTVTGELRDGEGRVIPPAGAIRDAALEEVAKALIARGYHETSDALQTVRALAKERGR